MKVEAGINNYRIENCGDYNNIRMNVVFSLDSNLKINLADKVEIDVPVSHNLEKYSDRDLEMELERRRNSFKDDDLVFQYKKHNRKFQVLWLDQNFENGKIYLWSSFDTFLQKTLNNLGFYPTRYGDLKMELERRKSKFKDGDLVFIFKKIQPNTCFGGWDKYLNSKYESGKIYLWPNSIDSGVLSVYGFKPVEYKELK